MSTQVAPASHRHVHAHSPKRILGFVQLIDWSRSEDPQLGGSQLHSLDVHYEHLSTSQCSRIGELPALTFHPDPEELARAGTVMWESEHEVTPEIMRAARIGIYVFDSPADLMRTTRDELRHSQDLVALVEITGLAERCHINGHPVWRASEIRVLRALYTDWPYVPDEQRIESLDEEHYWHGDWSGTRPWNAGVFERRYGIRVDSMPAWEQRFDLERMRSRERISQIITRTDIPVMSLTTAAGALWALGPAPASAALVALLGAGSWRAASDAAVRLVRRRPTITHQQFIDGWASYVISEVSRT